MSTVQQLLDAKGHTVWTVAPAETVYNAIRMMAEKDIGALLVLDNDRIVGIFSERDYARNVILKGKQSPQTPVRDVMASDVVYARPEQTVEDCMAIMTNRKIRHLPVLDRDHLVGVVSIGDLVKSIIEEQKYTIEQLENYIRS